MTYGFPLARTTPQYIRNFLYWHFWEEAHGMMAYETSNYVFSERFLQSKIQIMSRFPGRERGIT